MYLVPSALQYKVTSCGVSNINGILFVILTNSEYAMCTVTLLIELVAETKWIRRAEYSWSCVTVPLY